MHTRSEAERHTTHIHVVCVVVSRELRHKGRCAEKAGCCRSGHGNLLLSQLGGPSWLLMAPGQQPGTTAREGREPRAAVEVVNRTSEKNENLSPSEFPALSGMKRLLVCSC